MCWLSWGRKTRISIPAWLPGSRPLFKSSFPLTGNVGPKFHLPSAWLFSATHCISSTEASDSDISHLNILHHPPHCPAPPQPTSKSPVLRAWKATLKVSALPFREKPRLLRGVWQTMESRAACIARRSSSHSCFPGGQKQQLVNICTVFLSSQKAFMSTVSFDLQSPPETFYK